MRSLRLAAAFCAAALALAACSSASGGGRPSAGSSSAASSGSARPTVIPVVVNSDFGVGRNRFLFLFIDQKNNPVSAPDRTADVAFTAPGQPTPGAPVPATFLCGIENVRGYYVADATFAAAGDWSATFTTAAPGKPRESIEVQFQVTEQPVEVTVGQKAPSVKTPTLADVGGDATKIATDASPDPSFYRFSEDQALADHKPFALVFATPKFCTSALCGPQLGKLKAIAKDYPTITFINVEPYQLQLTDGQLQPILDANKQLQPVPAVDAFRIPSEPWLYVIDRTGTVSASLEGVFADAELRAALEAVK